MSTLLKVISDGSHDSAFNMSADLYLLDKCVDLDVVYLRIYTWSPPCVTLGYMQNPNEVLDLEKCKKNGIDWIKRPTGGRAVLHKNDLTYSIIFSKNISVMGKSIGETYEIISNALARGFNNLGINTAPHDSNLDSAEVRREIKLPCFLASNRDEITANGKKLVGSAQKRTSDAVLQHGSIPIKNDFRDLPFFERLDITQQKIQHRLLNQKCICVNDILENLDIEEISRGIINGFIQELPFDCEEIYWADKDLLKINSIANSESFKKRWME